MTDKIKVRISGTVRGSFSTEVEMSQEAFNAIDQLLDSDAREAGENIFDIVGPNELFSNCRIDDVDEFNVV